MGKHLVLAGAGHAHMVTLQNLKSILDRGHTITVIGPSAVHYYSGMGPGMLGGTYTPEDIRFDSRADVERQGASFIEDSVELIDPQARVVTLSSGKSVEYDVLSCNLGSSTDHRYSSSSTCMVFTVKPIEKLFEARNYLIKHGKSRSLRIAIIGGGPSAVELAGNLQQLSCSEGLNQPEVSIYCRSRLMNRFDAKVRNCCNNYLKKQGVNIVEGVSVESAEGGVIKTACGKTRVADVIFIASGIHPSSVFSKSGFTVGPDGGLPVNRYLQSIHHPEIFGGGDCIYFEQEPLDKVGVYAVRQNPVLYHNLIAALEGDSLQEFVPGGGYLLIFNLGNGYGVLQKGFLFTKGRFAFFLKDYIDRKFIKKFQ
ncbi:NAD(P)/FAD-dependent oxidoreductase [Desulfosediminicola flagellatus]|uniref:NAD(P)/FAD-dependent oxidoreductase n=1 Tax=Desulfosediminicola flagellatus TaxID=2569541 RepID=UPI0010AC61B0|nr:FAD-dependent oxidoreductase [Desulfosediminicola flagellatus]